MLEIICCIVVQILAPFPKERTKARPLMLKDEFRFVELSPEVPGAEPTLGASSSKTGKSSSPFSSLDCVPVMVFQTAMADVKLLADLKAGWIKMAAQTAWVTRLQFKVL